MDEIRIRALSCVCEQTSARMCFPCGELLLPFGLELHLFRPILQFDDLFLTRHLCRGKGVWSGKGATAGQAGLCGPFWPTLETQFEVDYGWLQRLRTDWAKERLGFLVVAAIERLADGIPY